MSESILIAGASARAAAASARRAGLRVTAADRFCDGDLPSYGWAIRIVDYPGGLAPIAARLPPTSWLYTGGLENEPELVDAVSQRHRLWGNPGATLRRVRDPWQVAAALGAAGLRHPQPQRRPRGGGLWVRKPRRGCGGTGVHRLRPRAAADRAAASAVTPAPPQAADELVGTTGARAPTGGWYYQPWIEGVACGAVFVAASGTARLIGVTRQLIGCRWAGAGGFQYVGSVGPLCGSAAVHDQFCRVGECLARAFNLRGLFGVDAIVAGEDVWPVEVNPRYTASVEVLERALGVPTILWHRAACRRGQLPPPVDAAGAPAHGKAVVYAARDAVMDARTAARLPAVAAWLQAGELADVPPRGARIPAGQPLLTLLTSGRDRREVVQRLRAGAAAVQRLLDAAAGAEAAIDWDHGP